MPSSRASDLSKATQRVIEICSVKGPKAFSALKAYWQPEYEARRFNRKIEHCLEPDAAPKEAELEALLVRRFAHAGGGNRGLTREYLHLLADQMIQNHSRTFSQEARDQLLELTQGLKASQLDDSSWRTLQFIATANGLFQVSLICRQRTVERILSAPADQCVSRQAIHRYFTAAMDDNRPDLAARALDQYRSRYGPKSESFEKMLLHFYLMQGQRQEALVIARRYYSAMDRAFADFVRGKRVAIVGPAPTDESAAEEIDQFDLVIRTNYRGRDTMPPAEEFGRKIDISYYNYTYTKQVLGDGDNSYLDDLSFAVFKNEIDIRRYHGRPTTAKFRTMRQINDQILNGKSQMVQNIVYDLLHFEPREIKIFKSNFFMSDKRYFSTYASPTNQSQKAASFWMNFATHDLVTQLNFTRTLLMNGQIICDCKANEILSMSNQEYMQTIQMLY
jgi:hypothetical protein